MPLPPLLHVAARGRAEVRRAYSGAVLVTPLGTPKSRGRLRTLLANRALLAEGAGEVSERRLGTLLQQTLARAGSSGGRFLARRAGLVGNLGDA